MFFDETNVLTTPNLFVNAESIKSGYKIPNIIHFTFCSKKLPIEILRVIQHNKNVCKNCDFIFYDDDDCKELIQKNFHQDMVLVKYFLDGLGDLLCH